MPTQTADAPAAAQPPSDDVEMTFTEHLAELRRRLLVAVLAVIAISVAAFPFMGKILKFVESMFLRGIPLHVFSPAEIIRVELKLSVLIGIVVSFPIILYEVYAFIAPALDRRIRHRVVWYALPSFAMSLLGLAFCGFVVLPFVMHALLRFTQNSGLIGTYQLEPTVGFIALLLGIFAVMFQLPIVLSVLASVGLVNARMLAAKWRHATLIIAIAAAIAAPDGNPLTMALLAAPLLALYGLSIAVVRFTQPKIAQHQLST
ncbi:MAG: twin-arginine translocase subunit TatC [Candidatus Eremiobacter antarcticus]|nr:twin-arginine translocase subunit TatC [Candidatus Eremiobacteraeota bacterium]MBC5808004.1 twin-arginine translocase subunit TatC [Candidatus Eremiobacteraeota bacterium]PZR62639.1 MAG: twin-arginine translocase subunit TatC [Candidatus Eremiobacter sp. RRmetagenome_bin22]